MIFDRLNQLERYQGISKALDFVLQTLKTTDLSTIPLGRTDLKGDQIFLNHFQYTTAAPSDADLYEAHQQHLDMHVVLSGREALSIAPIETLTPVEVREQEDSVMYKGNGLTKLALETGCFALLYPGEGHLPHLLLDDTPSQVDKIVFKILI